MTKELEKALRHIKTRSDLWAVREVEKALSQEPCDDAISREAVIKDFTQWRGKMAYAIGEDYSGVSMLDKAIRVIKGMPSVTQKSGKWIETEYHRWRCSVCREKGMSEWDNIHDVRTNFCPDCGARMESEEV